jgi:uncharacterized LabA/DUF88 family protein
VDVANIFYAAKAAGVDIDYVTLLKAATAGRDFVRAYAYTGLDPENDNQRQFHGFLARNGYKVISKDIRKYGDGRIKANLDLELVVDMMKTARNLDIAVVVSGDGDFASAIRAVQEMGVRVEVISFRGNTSSDLIEVADLFTDIAQIARVDKSGRSGRRVAAEGDLSMTEVPEKETEGLPRRRRGGRGTRDERPAAAAEVEEREARSGDLVVLPGERLSRAPDGEGTADEELEEEAAYAGSSNGVDAATEDGRRRRRRRGGRGRGRGRRPEDELVGTPGEPSGFDEDEEFEELPPPAQPPVHTFGSVWDSQLGVPTSASMPPTVDLGGGEPADDDEDYDEPEVPEYLLAERRQRGQRPGGRGRAPGGRNRSAYQAALDRERYGSRPSQPTGFGANSSSSSSRSSQGNRDRGRQGGRPQSQGRPQDRGPRPPQRDYVEQRSSTEPWSEVPPELEEMLRAEMARKQPQPEMTSAPSYDAMPPAEMPTEAPAAEAPAKPARKPRTSKKPTAAEVTDSPAEATAEATVETPATAPAKKPTRSRSTKAAAAPAAPAEETAPAEAASEAAPDAAPKKTTTRRRTTKSVPAEEA